MSAVDIRDLARMGKTLLLEQELKRCPMRINEEEVSLPHLRLMHYLILIFIVYLYFLLHCI